MIDCVWWTFEFPLRRQEKEAVARAMRLWQAGKAAKA